MTPWQYRAVESTSTVTGDGSRRTHPAWLEPHPKGFIPDFNDSTDLMWIESKLKESRLSKHTRAELETMQAAALNGTLRGSELDDWKKRGRRVDGARSFLSGMRSLRRRGAGIDKVPAAAIEHLDAAITLVSAAL